MMTESTLSFKLFSTLLFVESIMLKADFIESLFAFADSLIFLEEMSCFILMMLESRAVVLLFSMSWFVVSIAIKLDLTLSLIAFVV